MRYCHECGAECSLEVVNEVRVPRCPHHGHRWVLVRTGAAADVVVQRDGRALLVRRAIDPFIGQWATVGGFINPGEHPRDTARREAREELGMRVHPVGILGVYAQPYRKTEWLVTTLYVGTTDDEPTPDRGEVDAYGWFGPDDLPALMAWNHRQRMDDWARWIGTGRPLTEP